MVTSSMRRCAYVSIRQHTSGTSLCIRKHTSAYVRCTAAHTSVSHTSAHVSIQRCMRCSGYVSIREHTLEDDTDELDAPTAPQFRHTGVNAYLRAYEAHALFVFRCSRTRLQQRRHTPVWESSLFQSIWNACSQKRQSVPCRWAHDHYKEAVSYDLEVRKTVGIQYIYTCI
jgi:hypothetical protein